MSPLVDLLAVAGMVCMMVVLVCVVSAVLYCFYAIARSDPLYYEYPHSKKYFWLRRVLKFILLKPGELALVALFWFADKVHRSGGLP